MATSVLELKISDNAEKAAQGLAKLSEMMNKLKQSATGGMGLTKVAKQVGQLGTAVDTGLSDTALAKLERLANVLQKLKSLNGVRLPRVPKSAASTEGGTPAIQQVSAQSGGVQDAIPNFTQVTTAAGQAQGKLQSLGATIGQRLSPMVEGLGARFRTLVASMRETRKGAISLGNNFLRVALYRGIDLALQAVIDGFKEGVKNLYAYSSAVNGTFAKSMDAMSSKFLQAKNTVATVFAPALNALTPILQQIANAAILVMNVIAQLIALLSGSTGWTEATEAVTTYGEAVGGAAGKQKNLLAGFDQINLITSKGGGGGGSSLGNFADMFQESEFSPFFKWMQEHLVILKGLVSGIAAGLLAWRLASGFSDSISKIAGFALTIGGTVTAVIGFLDALQNGIAWDNLATQIGGFAAAIGGLALLFGKTGAAIGSILSGVLLLVEGFGQLLVTGEATNEVLTAISAGFILVGGGISLLTGSWIPLLISAVAAAITWIVAKWDTITTFFSTNVVEPLKNLASRIGSEIQAFLTDPIGYIQEKWAAVCTWWSINVTTPLNELITGLSSDLSTFWTDPVGSIKNAWLTFSTWFNNNVVSPVANFFIGGINKIIDAVNWLIGKLNGLNFTVPSFTLFGKTYGGTTIGFQDIPTIERIGTYAEGGFPSVGEMFVARESGPEMVGRIGNRTAVANNQQIVEGVAQGVADANADQNRLLAEQNNLLRQILAKTGDGAPSANFGRMASQSIAMYERTAGIG